jgi:hypothetical protein
MLQDNKAKNKKILTLVGVVLGVFILIGLVSGTNETTGNQEPPKVNQQQSKNDKIDTATNETNDPFMDAMRKCAVMEAYDINTTGIGAKTDNAFNDGRKFCELLFNDVYKNDRDSFISDVATDWNTKKSKQVDGKDLTYYLSILGW